MKKDHATKHDVTKQNATGQYARQETIAPPPVDRAEDSLELPVNPHPVMRYTVLRLAIFAVALGLLWLVRVRGLLLVALAVLISGLASYALLQRQRDAMSVRLAETTARRRARSAARAAREDDLADELSRDESPAEDLSARPQP